MESMSANETGNGIYTIGHSNHDLDYFTLLLRKYNINCLVDVRNVPFSKYVPQYNKDTIKNYLNRLGIYCIYMGEELGAIRDDKSLLSPDGYVDFCLLSQTDFFKRGLERIKKGCGKGYIIGIMCTEKDPIDCHRSILISRKLKEQGYNLLHILPDGSLESTPKLEERLVKLYFSEGTQQSFLNSAEVLKGETNLLDRAYSLRNKDIGYRPKIQ